MHRFYAGLEGSYRADAKWPAWFEKLGINPGTIPKGIFVDSYTNMIQAALSGQGVALGDMPLLDNLISQGVLVCPLEIEPIVRDYFFLVLPRGTEPVPATDCFCEWLRSEVTVIADFLAQPFFPVS